MAGISSPVPLYPLRSPLSSSQHPDPHGYAIQPFIKEAVAALLLQMEPLRGRTALLVQVAWLLLVSVCSSPVTWQRANASGALFDGMSPEDHGLRPANPLDELPPPDLIEPPNKMLDPTPLDLNVTALRAMLGRNFDPQFMSIARPRYEVIFIRIQVLFPDFIGGWGSAISLSQPVPVAARSKA
jgi:hypothetical protein